MIPLTCWHNPGSLEWIAAPLAWHIQRSAFERVCLWLLDMSLPTALNPICSKRVPIDRASAEDSDDIFKIPWNFTRNKLEPSPMRPIYIPIDGSWRQDFKHIIFIDLTRTIQKLCFLHPPACIYFLMKIPGAFQKDTLLGIYIINMLNFSESWLGELTVGDRSI